MSQLKEKIEKLIEERNQIKNTIVSEDGEQSEIQVSELDKQINDLVNKLNIEVSEMQDENIIFG